MQTVGTRPIAVRRWPGGMGARAAPPVASMSPTDEDAWVKVAEAPAAAAPAVPVEDRKPVKKETVDAPLDDDDDISDDEDVPIVRNPFVKVGNKKIQYKRKPAVDISSVPKVKKLEETKAVHAFERSKVNRCPAPGSSTSRDGTTRGTHGTARGISTPRQQPSQRSTSTGKAVDAERSTGRFSSKGKAPAAADDDDEEYTSVYIPSSRHPKHGAASSNGPPPTEDSRAVMLRTMKTFELLRRHLVRQEAEKKSGRSKPHLMAMKIIKQRELGQDSSMFIGNVPGLEVGDIFYYRSAMNVVGLHGPLQGGISTVKPELNPFGVSIANSIVLSGGYEDDHDQGETFVYTGAGGNNYKGDKTQCTDQELQRGNKGLVNSCKYAVPIRVTRGCSDPESPTSKTYSYDGLYKVDRYWEDIGKSGHKVYKFHLTRNPNQAPLTSSLVGFGGGLEVHRSQVVNDISHGEELEKINVVNHLSSLPPPAFKYRAKMRYLDVKLARGVPCGCQGICGKGCGCVEKNGRAPYTPDKALVSSRTIVYECGPGCKCGPTCHTKVAQLGIRRKMQAYKTEKKGWGLRACQTIPAGSFVCEIVGEVVTVVNPSAAQRHLLYDLDSMNTKCHGLLDVSGYFDDLDMESGKGTDLPDIGLDKKGFFVDASRVGNVSRFINHSCSPNLMVQCVLYDHGDTGLPHLMLFALDNIRAFEELTYDYTAVMKLDDHVTACLCGSRICRQWL